MEVLSQAVVLKLPVENYQAINMRNDHYPAGFVRALLNTDSVTPQTRDILIERIERKKLIVPVFFDENIFLTLTCVCEHLIPQPNRDSKIDLAGLFDEMLAEGKGNGWRYNKMPPDGEAYKKGIQGINETSELMFGAAFKQLDEPKQIGVLSAVQKNIAPGKTWETLPANLFFEELLAQIVEIYYSHPWAKEEIGEVAFSDAKGWQKIGLNELEAWEPKAINK